MGTGGNVTLHYCDKPFSVSTDCIVLFPKINLSPKYLYYFFKANFNILQSGFKGAGLKHTSKKYINEITINHIPGTEEQIKVLNILDKLIDIIVKKNQQLSEYDQLIKSRFFEMFEDTKNFKKNWQTGILGNFLTIVRGASPRPIESYLTDNDDGINWIKIGDAPVNSMYITFTKERITTQGADKSRYVKEGDFLLSNSMSFGRPYILKTSGCVHDGWLVLSNYEKNFNKFFLYSLLNSKTIYNKFKSIVVGGVVNNLNSEMVRNLKVNVPPMEVQVEFAELLQQIDKLKICIQQSIKETQNLFDSLMQEYFE
jgi:restriction endonuclease S subunit